MHSHLPRLSDEAYKGFNFIHWVFTVQDRRRGWLTGDFHSRWREMLLHTSARYGVHCPVYCLMPDHVHLILAGISEQSDQRQAVKFLRTHSSRFFGDHRWQRQSFDHVLRNADLEKEAFAKICYYVLDNPVRGGLVKMSKEYSYSGAVISGYPDINPHQIDHWSTFWGIYNQKVSGQNLTISATGRTES